ncbi:hypothetical protein PRZ48_013911 [Zasmidium cellare]|uniref:Uncharacterized protein n=1 Tax=Zasmidium cellare TaxID=395010 RepID=A0ABR0DZI8_ZASCE|nr:hypothetical protein PRZ48_013911 [Zasmidium cellare]
MMGSESVSIKRETEDDVDIPKKNQLCFREPDLEKMQIASPSVKREFKTEVDSPETKHLHLEAFPPNPGPEVSQTAPPSLKREADTELSSSKTKQPCLEAQSQKPPPSRKPAPSSEPEPSSQLPPSRPKRPLPTQECNVCNEDAATNQFKKFKTCAKKDCNKTCTFCWTKHIKTHGIEFPLQPIKCFGCEEPLEKEMVVKLLNGNERDVAQSMMGRRGSPAVLCVRLRTARSAMPLNIKARPARSSKPASSPNMAKKRKRQQPLSGPATLT